MKRPSPHFTATQKLLHWTMAALIITMLFIGIALVTTLSHAHDTLVALHRPLGIAILLLVVVRIGVRLRHGSPPLPSEIPLAQRKIAAASHVILYALMVAMPLIGWGMLSAGGYPVKMFGAVNLPAILPHDVTLFAMLRALHTWLAFALFALVMLHLAAALIHGLIRRDGVFSAMAPRIGQR